jgi:hypothetical protein
VEGSGDPSATYSTTAANSIIGIGNFSASGLRMMLGVNTNTPSTWIQNQYTTNQVTASLLLNPIGGNVGIGTTSPQNPLHVSGSLRVGPFLTPDRDGFVFIPGGTLNTIQANNENTNFDNNQGNIHIRTTNNSSVAPVERITVLSTGNVGIGTTSPDEKLDITGGYLKFNGGDYGIKGSASLTYNPVSDHYFMSSGSTKVTIKASGNVGIGTTSPDFELDVAGNIGIDGKIYHNGDTNTYIGFEADDIKLRTGGSDVITVNSSQNVGIGTTSPAYKLDVAGPTDSQGFVNDEGGNKNRLLFPKGGSFNSGPTTGAITVKLPVLWTNTMLRITLRVFDYSHGKSFDVTVAGYNYEGFGSGGSWVNTSAWISSESDIDRNFSVRFGNDGTNSLFYIGELASSWSYLKVNIVDVELNHAATVTDWSTTAWSISMETTAFANVSQTRTNCQVNNWKRSGQDLYYGSGTGNVGIGVTSIPSWANLITSGTVAVGGRLYIKSNNSIQGLSGFPGSSDKLIINPDGGNVGIGTTSPGTLGAVAFTNVGLHVYSGNFGRTVTEGATSAEFLLRDAGASANQKIKTIIGDGGKLYFGAVDDNGTQRKHVTIDDSGNVGIGTTSPLSKLHVNGGNISIQNVDSSSPYTASGKLRFLGRYDRYLGGINTVNTGSYAEYDNGLDFYVQRDTFDAAGHFAMRINHLGNVGIGTTSPNRSLHVIGQVAIDNSTSPSGGLLVSPDGTSNKVYSRTGNATSSAHPLDFISGSSTSMRITSAGNVGIGTTSPGAKLDVNGNILISDTGNDKYFGSNVNLILNADADAQSGDSARNIIFQNRGSEKMRITSAGKVGIGTTSPAVNLDILKPDGYGFPVTSGTTQTNGKIRIGSTGTVGILDIGSGSTSQGGWLQSTRSDDLSQGYNLLLNPNGGNVGIGTTSPTEKLNVSGNILATGTILGSNLSGTNTGDQTAGTGLSLTGTQFSLDTGGIGAGTYGSTADGTKIDTIAVDAYGRVTGIATGPTGSIGTSGFTMNDGAQIKTYQDTNSGSSQSAATLITENDINTGGSINWWSEVQNGSFGTYNHAVFYHGTSQAGAIQRSGNTTVSYITSSDYRLKENVVEITDGIERVKQLKPSKFNFIGEDRIVDGFLAHEVQGVVPESISGEKDEVDNDGNPVYQGIDQSKIVPLLAGALKEAISKIEQLETRIQTLENKQL